MQNYNFVKIGKEEIKENWPNHTQISNTVHICRYWLLCTTSVPLRLSLHMNQLFAWCMPKHAIHTKLSHEIWLVVHEMNTRNFKIHTEIYTFTPHSEWLERSVPGSRWWWRPRHRIIPHSAFCLWDGLRSQCAGFLNECCKSQSI